MQYLNTKKGVENFTQAINNDLYVDKSMIISILNNRINTTSKYVCITRPRRFGKSQLTFLLEAYYTRAICSKSEFNKLAISKVDSYNKHINKYNVVKIDFSKLEEKDTYEQYIGRIKMGLSLDLEEAYPETDFSKVDLLSEKFSITGEKFIFIFDEWDFIFNQHRYSEEENKQFLEFIRNLLKDNEYVALCYMTGILPIKQHSKGSALNMFSEYSFLKDTVLDTFCGFTEQEANRLCETSDSISYEEMSYWYNGYVTAGGNKIFNPRSVVEALRNNNCQSYWTNVGGMNEILEYLKIDTTGVMADVVRMINGETIRIAILREFRAGSTTPRNREEIYSAMITWGFLSYYNEEVQIPNNELMIEFVLALREDCFGEVANLLKNSDDMLFATINKDEKRVAQIVHDIHNSEIPILKYTDENSTSCVLTLAYLSARNRYRIEREEKSGKGYVDFILHPKNRIDPPIIVELKRN
ncbi:MAG: AAA family ATPase, partial [Epulopiscium sp. Nele67-Bin004]